MEMKNCQKTFLMRRFSSSQIHLSHSHKCSSHLWKHTFLIFMNIAMLYKSKPMNCSLANWLKHFRYCHFGQVIRFPAVSLKPVLKATGESAGHIVKHTKLCVFSDLLSSASGCENLHNPENCCFEDGSSSFSEREQILFLFYVKYTGQLWSIRKRFQICLGIWGGGGDPWRLIWNKTRKCMSIVLQNELVLLPSFLQSSFPPFAFVLCWV